MENKKEAKDKVFDKREGPISDFKFGPKVVSVFDDMVSRSVPFYHEIQRMITELSKDFATKGSNVYDLGCSTGTTLINLNANLDKGIRFVGVDDSADMLKICDKNFKKAGVTRDYKLICDDVTTFQGIENASVVILCLTLQFIRPLRREKLIEEIYNKLNDNGCLILVEKVLGEDSLFNRLFIQYYYDYKRRNEYSELEISQKREALENVLIPYKLEENKELLARRHFRHSEVFFKWYNFSGIIAIK